MSLSCHSHATRLADRGYLFGEGAGIELGGRRALRVPLQRAYELPPLARSKFNKSFNAREA
jgi:hypothetical protein